MIWDIALSCVKRTFGTKEIPERLLTVHVRPQLPVIHLVPADVLSTAPTRRFQGETPLRLLELANADLRSVRQTWCDSGENCTPAVDRYAEQVNSLLKDAPKGTKGTSEAQSAQLRCGMKG